MNSCPVIRDLLPLYVDDVLSKESKELVSVHLTTCEYCTTELTNIQSKIAIPQYNSTSKINVLKLMKKKVFIQKVIVAIAASLLAIVVILGGFSFVFHHATPVSYTSENIWMEISTIQLDFYNNGVFETVNVLDLVSAGDFDGSHTSSRVVNINGVETKVMYIYLTQTLSTRWWPNENRLWFRRIGGIGENLSFAMGGSNFPLIPWEIYYLVAPFDEWPAMSDEDFLAQRENGILLWSGTLKPQN